MAEREWEDAENPIVMLDFFRGSQIDTKDGFIWTGAIRYKRKLRLFACACCRQIWALLEDESREAVSKAEQFADGLCSGKALQEANRKANRFSKDRMREAMRGNDDGLFRKLSFALMAGWASDDNLLVAVYEIEREWKRVDKGCSAICCDILRDLFSNADTNEGSGPTVIETGPEAAAIARTIYDNHEFGRMSELGELLERAGVADNEILGHCREGRVHARGCWALDKLLGRF